MTDKKQPAGEYEVGYCKPPEATLFKKGGPCGNYGRKGKPENRAAIAARKAELTMQQTITKASHKRGKVRTPDGRITTMSTREILVEQVMQSGLKDPKMALKAIDLIFCGEKSAAKEPDQPNCGVMVIQQPAATVEQAMARVRLRSEELKRLASFYGGKEPPLSDQGRRLRSLDSSVWRTDVDGASLLCR